MTKTLEMIIDYCQNKSNENRKVFPVSERWIPFKNQAIQCKYAPDGYNLFLEFLNDRTSADDYNETTAVIATELLSFIAQ
jgi:hypothetical protein